MSMSKPISRYPVPNLEEVPEDVRQRMVDVQEKALEVRIRAERDAETRDIEARY